MGDWLTQLGELILNLFHAIAEVLFPERLLMGVFAGRSDAFLNLVLFRWLPAIIVILILIDFIFHFRWIKLIENFKFFQRKVQAMKDLRLEKIERKRILDGVRGQPSQLSDTLVRDLMAESGQQMFPDEWDERSKTAVYSQPQTTADESASVDWTQDTVAFRADDVKQSAYAAGDALNDQELLQALSLEGSNDDIDFSSSHTMVMGQALGSLSVPHHQRWLRFILQRIARLLRRVVRVLRRLYRRFRRYLKKAGNR